MSRKIVPFMRPRRRAEDVREQACAWLVDIDAGLSATERERLQEWLDEDPRHAQAMLEMARFWDQLNVLSELSNIFSLEQFPAAEPPEQPQRRRAGAARTGWVAAATLVLASGAAWVAASGWFGPTDESSTEPTVQRYATEVGEQLTVELEDGSEVILNTDTRVEVDYSAEQRAIVLERGEAHFTVAPETERPFLVEAGSRVIRAVGTSFAVLHLEPGSVEVMVTAGRIAIAPSAAGAAPAAPRERQAAEEVERAERVSLGAGEFAAVNAADGALQRAHMQPEEIDARLAWRYGMLLFQGEPLEVVLAEVARYTAVEIEADETVRDIPVFGYFRAGDVERLIAAMRENFQISARRVSPDRVVLTDR